MKIEHSIHIAAPPSLVWDVTADVDRWPEWTPTMMSVHRVDSGPFRHGSQAEIVQPGMPKTTWTVVDFVAGKRFAWAARARGMHLTGTHELTIEPGGTRNTLTVEVRGLPAMLFWPVLRVALQQALAQENAGLKARCEERVRT